jgi:hypothetical protein
MHIPRHKRLFALALAIATDIGFYFLPIQMLETDKATFLLSLICTIVAAFATSELLHRIHIDALKFKYPISGVCGVIMGFSLYFWLENSTIVSADWLNEYGKLALIFLNLIAVLFIFLYRPKLKGA